MRHRKGVFLGAVSLLVAAVLFVVPFVFILLTALKDRQEANLLKFTWPTHIAFVQNLREVIAARDYQLVIAFINSTILTVSSVALLVVLAAMVAYVLQRRPGRWTRFADFLVLAGLIVPPAVVPTVWVLQKLGIFRTMSGLILVEVAFGMAFCVLLFKAFIATIPRELDEAAAIDGAAPLRLFFPVILPVLRTVIITVIEVQSV